MENTNNKRCLDCGFVSDTPAKFCRQCGHPLITESNATSADTHNFNPYQHTTTKDTQHLPKSFNDMVTDEQSGVETEMFNKQYAPPAFSKPTGGKSFKAPVPVGKRSNVGLWLVVILLAFVLVGSSVAGYVISVIRPYLNVEDKIAQELKEKAMNEAMEALKAAKEKDGNLSINVPILGSPEEQKKYQDIIKQYEYPNAASTKSVNIGKVNIHVVETDDSISVVRDYYVSKVGQPMMDSKSNNDNESLIFKIKELPGYNIMVTNNDEDSYETTDNNKKRTKIVITFTGLNSYIPN